MPVRGPGRPWSTRGCRAALELTAIASLSLAATASDGPRLVPPAGASADTPAGPHPIVLFVDNLASLPERELETAQARATTILRTAALEPTWVEAGTESSIGRRMWIVLGPADRSERLIARLKGPADLLGMAPPGSRRVYIFSERIHSYAASTHRSFDEVLGHVLAHEVGHHLLPGQPHADTGIMQADIGQALSTPWFTGRQLRSIHRSLSDAPAAGLQARAERGQ